MRNPASDLAAALAATWRWLGDHPGAYTALVVATIALIIFGT